MAAPRHNRRRLYYVPILHAEADLGTLAAHARSQTDPDAWKHKQLAISQIWDAIEAWADSLGDLHTYRIYQDGLPVCGKEPQIIHDLAAAGSRNHQLLQKWAARGAEIMGSESPPLLVREYELARRMLTRQAPPDESDRLLAAELLDGRDRFIADRINITLTPGHTGVLLIGLLHRVPIHLAKDIDVVVPFSAAA